ncbi:MAG: GxxExxY protein [Patescibacteria group bacterium]
MNTENSKIVFPELSYAITGIIFDVHNNLGRYCNEEQYADAIARTLQEKGMVYEREKVLPPSFDGEAKGRNMVDFFIENKVVLELKAKRMLTREDYYQVRRYLGALDFKLGLLINFRDKYVRPRRILNSGVS